MFLYLPLLAVAAMSLNAARFGGAWKGFSLQWYAQLAGNEVVLAAAGNTLLLAAVSTAVATVLGTLLAIGLDRFPWPRWLRRVVDAVVYVPVVTPDIVFAVGMLLAFEAARQVLGGLRLGMGTMIVAHVTFQISFVALVVGSRLATIGRSVEEAARDLYAGHVACAAQGHLPPARPRHRRRRHARLHPLAGRLRHQLLHLRALPRSRCPCTSTGRCAGGSRPKSTRCRRSCSS